MVIKQQRHVRVFHPYLFAALQQVVANLDTEPIKLHQRVKRARRRNQVAEAPLAHIQAAHAFRIAQVAEEYRGHRRQERVTEFREVLTRKFVAPAAVQVQE